MPFERVELDPPPLIKRPPITFHEEKPGWEGYIEWEKYPEKKKIAQDILHKYTFSQPPEFQFAPLPDTNPVIDSPRWKEYHDALGIGYIVDHSWDVVQKEKPDIIHLLKFPYNGETRRHQLLEGKITDNKYHFVRNHGGIPDIDEVSFELEIGGLVKSPVKLSLKDLKDPDQFPQHEVTVTLQCSGTRRIEQIREYPGDGDELINAPWGEGAIGTAVYRGVPLKKVLKYAAGGVLSECQHVEFIGAETYFKKNNVFNYAVSVPYRKVRANEEVLLAWEMNGEPLPKIHGFPLRVVVTGYIGARSCKWLYKINCLAEPSMGPVQRQEYLYYTAQIGKQNAKYSNGFSIQQMPVSSAIIEPEDKKVVIHDGGITLRGWAYSGGGNWVERVEVSPDGGSVWYAAKQEDMTDKHYHAWRLWKIDVPVDAEGWLEFCVRTWDSSNNTEPTYVRSAWNWDLHVTSSAHRIKVYSVNKSRPETAARLKFLDEHGLTFEPLTRPIEASLETEEDYLESVTILLLYAPSSRAGGVFVVEALVKKKGAQTLNYPAPMESEQRDIMPLISSTGPTRDKEYYFEDGSCIFLVENVLFNVHRSMLSRDGSSFGTMFSLPQGGAQEGKSDESPIVLAGETASEFRHFLSALYALPPQLRDLTSPTANLSVLISIARVSNKYAFRSLEAWALEAIQDYVNRNPSPILSSIPHHASYIYSPSDSADLSTTANVADASTSPANASTAQLTRLIRLAQLCGHTPLLNTMINFLRELMSKSLQYAYLAMTLSDELGLKSLRGAAYLEVMHKAQIVRPLELDLGLTPSSSSLPSSSSTSSSISSSAASSAAGIGGSTAITHSQAYNNLALGAMANALAPLTVPVHTTAPAPIASSSNTTAALSSSPPNTTGTCRPLTRLVSLPITPPQRLRLLTGYYRLSHTWDLLRMTPPSFEHAPSCATTWHQHGCTQAWHEFWKDKTAKSDAVLALGAADVLGRLKAIQKEFERWGSAAYMHNDCRVSARKRMGEVVKRVEEGLSDCFESEGEEV